MDYYDLRAVGGDPIPDGEITPLLPFLLMDAGWIYVQRNILTLDCRRDLKHYRKMMREAYSDFMDYLYRPFDEEEADHIITKMGQMEDAVNNDLMMVQLVYVRAFQKDTTFVQHQVLSSALMCNELAYLGEACMEKTLRDYGVLAGWKRASSRLRCALREFTKRYMDQQGIPNNFITDEQVHELDIATLNLEKGIVKWIKEERQ